MNRETWLQKAVERLRPLFVEVGAEIPRELQVSVAPISKRAIGLAYHPDASYDEKTRTLVICASLEDPLDPQQGVLPTLVHELVHVCLPKDAKHGPKFKALATSLGLAGRMTSTHANEELLERLRPIAEALGPYPHTALKKKARSWKGKRTKHLRLRSVVDYDYWVYMDREMYDEHGAPVDPWGEEMVPSKEAK